MDKEIATSKEQDKAGGERLGTCLRKKENEDNNVSMFYQNFMRSCYPHRSR